MKVTVIKRGGPYGPDHTKTLEGWNYDDKTGRLTVKEEVDNESDRQSPRPGARAEIPWAPPEAGQESGPREVHRDKRVTHGQPDGLDDDAVSAL